MDDGVAVDIVNTGHDALLEFLFRCDADMAQDRASELGEEALDEVQPRTMLGREGELEASSWSSVEPSSGFSRYVGGMIVEDQLDRGTGWISGVEKLEEVDELY